jgi:arabinose-5-phosphate isomerase
MEGATVDVGGQPPEERTMTEPAKYIPVARRVLEDEAASVSNLTSTLGEGFIKVCEEIEHCHGRVIFMGVGQSFHAARKSACSLASLGRPSFYIHATEAIHGDMGLIKDTDVVILISHSGETKEILATLGPIGAIGASTIALVGRLDSTLGKACRLALTTDVVEEAGPIKFAPSSSALATIALCDAIIMAVATSIGFTEADYSRCHPGGAIGERLSGSARK